MNGCGDIRPAQLVMLLRRTSAGATLTGMSLESSICPSSRKTIARDRYSQFAGFDQPY
jgi:hypothetical protein